MTGLEGLLWVVLLVSELEKLLNGGKMNDRTWTRIQYVCPASLCVDYVVVTSQILELWGN